jgi:peptidoglycan/LPS O-acetylase OafA/YrhL
MLSSLLQAAYAWLMSFGCLGIFRRWMSHPSPRVRWLSDASYWLYLSHLPVLFVLQAPIRSWPVSSYVKFSLTCSLCTILLLLVYHWCVRETWIGVLLNGPRKKAEVK